MDINNLTLLVSDIPRYDWWFLCRWSPVGIIVLCEASFMTIPFNNLSQFHTIPFFPIISRRFSFSFPNSRGVRSAFSRCPPAWPWRKTWRRATAPGRRGLARWVARWATRRTGMGRYGGMGSQHGERYGGFNNVEGLNLLDILFLDDLLWTVWMKRRDLMISASVVCFDIYRSLKEDGLQALIKQVTTKLDCFIYHIPFISWMNSG